MMAKLMLQLSGRTQIAEGTMSFLFDLAGRSYPFQPGQFIRPTLSDPPHPDPKGNVRSFSIASSPADPFLMIAVRMTGSTFKTSLAEMPLGTPVSIGGPFGKFVLDANSDAPVALFAGGIGITPFHSMIKHACENASGRQLLLVYSNRCPEQAAFLQELEDWARHYPHFRLFATMTQPELSKTPWNGPTGHVDVDFVRRVLLEEPVGGCFVAGPPGFVSGVFKVLCEAGMPKERIRTDTFIGY